MIHHRDSHTVALLADDRVVCKPDPSSSVTREVGIIRERATSALIPPEPKSEAKWSCLTTDCSQVRTHKYSRVLVVLTNDDRVLMTPKANAALKDITPTIKDLIGEDAISIRNMHLTGDALVFTTGRHLGAIRVSRRGWAKITAGTHLIFGHEIDLVAFDDSSLALVRTVDNKLHLINSRSWANNKLHWPLHEIAFCDTENISKMLYVGDHFTLLTQSGRVYVYNCYIYTGLAEPFDQLRIPADEAVVKIVNSYWSVIYLTDKGNCYYMNLNWGQFYIRRPRLLQALKELFVENVFWLDYCKPIGIVQHDGKLTYFRLAVVADGEGHIPPCLEQFDSYCDGCSNTVIEMWPLPFFDNKCIVSVVNIPSDRTYFITDEGHVYSAVSIDEATVYKRDTFFDANPIAVEKGTQYIRSAGSMLGQ